jgi:hypothetical protein
MGLQDFIFGHSGLFSMIAAWFVILTVFVITIVVFAINHITFTSVMIMLSIEWPADQDPGHRPAAGPPQAQILPGLLQLLRGPPDQGRVHDQVPP